MKLTAKDTVGRPTLFEHEDIKLHKKYLKVKKSSIAKAGLGVFAKRDIKKDTWIGTMRGNIVGTNAKHVLHSEVAGESGSILVDIEGPLRFANHSSEPNIYLVNGWSVTETWAYTVRGISKGEELLWTYFNDEDGMVFNNCFETNIEELHPLSVVAWLKERNLLTSSIAVAQWFASLERN